MNLRTLLCALALIAGATDLAAAQGLIAPGHVLGNGTTTNPRAPTDASITSVLDQGACGTNAAALLRIAGVWACSSASGAAVTFGGNLTAQQQIILSGRADATIAGDQNNYSPTGYSTASALFIDGGVSDRNITGLAGGTEGRIVTIVNKGTTNNLVLKNLSGSSSAANQFSFGGQDVTLLIGKQLALRYDGTAAVWRALSRADANTGVTTGSYGGNGKYTTLTVGLDGRLTAAGDGTLTQVNGVTYPASYTSGGVPYASASGTISASGLLTANAFLTGGGAGNPPNAVAITGLVIGNGASAPTGYGGASCTNQFLRSLTASGGPTCATVGSSDLAASLSLTTPNVNVATATSINKVAITAPATSATLTIPDGVTMTGPASNATVAGLGITNAFTGANSFSGVTTYTGSIAVGMRTVTAAGAVTVSATTDYLICVNKTVGAATTVNLPASPATGLTFLIKDCKGDASSNNITITPNAGNIDNAGSYIMNTNLGSVGVTYSGAQWLVN